MTPSLIIADDDPAMRWLVRAMFRDELGVVAEASDGRELFWHLLRSSWTRPATDVVVITDVQMPAYDGLAILDAYNELDFHPPTVVMTRFPDATTCDSIERSGGVLISKPFTASELRRAVDRARRR